MRKFLLIVAAIVAVAGTSYTQTEALLRSTGDLKRGPVSVFFGNLKLGEIHCQATFTEPTKVFASTSARLPEQLFSMNVEFLRDIVRVSDAAGGCPK